MRRVQWSLHTLAIGSGLTLGLTAPLTAVLAMELGAGAFTAGISVASLPAVVLVLDILGTRLLPFLEPRRAIVHGMLLWALGSFGSAVAPTFAVMAGFRLVQGVGLALYAAAAPQLAVRLAGRDRVGRAIGRFQAAMTLGSAAGPLAGGAVSGIGVGTAGLRLAFAVCGLLAVSCAVFARFTLPSVPPLSRPRWSLPSLPGMGRPRAVLGLWMGSAGQGLRGAIGLTVVPLVAAEVLDLDGVRLGVFLTAMYLVEVVTTAVLGARSDLRGRRSGVVLGAAVGVLGVGVVFAAMSSTSVPVLFAAAVPLGVAGGCMFGVLPALLVDLAGTTEVGLSATRIARDLGSSACMAGAGAVITVAGATAALGLCIVLYLTVGVGMLVVGETRTALGS
ncbi:MAG: transporter, family, inner rane transport protein [Kribbellaceae bacterium]|jgi:MFS family permease|nr:transporter, family, inner rane transport protein [Kribbellaceae bacterium]MDX6295407.1 transporter, family, inner rane transport protein [Kribbellaceae bacterium]